LTSDSIAQFQNGGLTLVSDVFDAVSGQPITALSTDVLQASISAGSDLTWTLGNITLRLSPNVEGAITIRKAGEVFRLTEQEKGDDRTKRQIVTVPSGKAYVSITLRVNIGVAAAGGFSQGAFGIKGSAQVSDNFLLANHAMVSDATTVLQALQTAF